MKLEKIEMTAARERVHLCFDDGTNLRVPVSVVGDLGLRAEMEISEAALTQISEAAGRASARQRAVRILAASGVSEKELRRRLRQKGEREEDAAEAVAWLKDLDLLDDRESARRIVEQGAAKGYGNARVRQMLYEKGIARELWDEALEYLPPADQAIDRYLAAHCAAAPDPKQKKKITDALLRRGHSWEDIRAGFARHAIAVEEESSWHTPFP